MESLERSYWTKEISQKLKIGESTLRKWCLQLEAHGYTFLRDEQERRAFTQKDIIFLQEMSNLIKKQGQSVEKAARKIAEQDNKNTHDTGLKIDTYRRTHSVLQKTSNYPQHIDDLRCQLEDMLIKQEKINYLMYEKIKKQGRYIRERETFVERILKEMEDIKKELTNRKRNDGFFGSKLGVAIKNDTRSRVGNLKWYTAY